MQGASSKKMLVETEKIFQAVSVLKQVSTAEKPNKGKSNLFEEADNESVYLQVSLKKIPVLQHLQYHKIKLPHPFMFDLKDVCLLTSDVNKKKPDDDESVAHYSQILRKANISVGQIIPYHQLRTEYKTYEARRHLAKSFQTFINDGKISKLMPVALGTFFVRKKKMPISISLNPVKVKEEFKRVLSKTTMTLSGRGSSCGVKVGLVQQTDDELLGNISAVISYLEENIPGKSKNIQSLHLKTKFSLSVPVYISLESANDVEIPTCHSPDTPVEGDLSTLTRSKVQVFPSGKVRLQKVDADDIDNENVDFEKRALANQRYHKNKTKREMDKKFMKALMKEGSKQKKILKGKKKKETKKNPNERKKTQATEIKSLFGFSHGGKTSESKHVNKKGSVLEEMNTMFSPDKSFEDSFRIQSLKSNSAHKSSVKQNDKEEVIPKKSIEKPLGRIKRPRLPSSKHSYSTVAIHEVIPGNECTQLLSYSKRNFADNAEIKEEENGGQPKVGKRKKRNGTIQEKKNDSLKVKQSKTAKRKSKSEGKISRLQSIRQSVRLAQM